MSKYCLVKDGVIVKYNVDKPKVIVGSVDGEYLPLVDNAPAYDSATQRIAGTEYIVGATEVTKTYTVVDIPAEEIFAKKKELVSQSVQNLLDTKAKEAGYDSIISACSYTGSVNFGAEATSFLNWRDAVWTYVFQVEADVLAGTRTEPTLDELLAELPTRV